MTVQMPKSPSFPVSLAKKGAIPAVFLAALASPLAYTTLERWEGNVLSRYRDNLAGGISTFCAGRTDWKAPIGEKLTSDQCQAVNKTTILEYGYAVLGCVEWERITAKRLIGLTMFAINVGKEGACNSQAVRMINIGEIAQGCALISTTPAGLPNWSSAGGKYVQGLQNRRLAERKLCEADL